MYIYIAGECALWILLFVTLTSPAGWTIISKGRILGIELPALDIYIYIYCARVRLKLSMRELFRALILYKCPKRATKCVIKNYWNNIIHRVHGSLVDARGSFNRAICCMQCVIINDVRFWEGWCRYFWISRHNYSEYTRRTLYALIIWLQNT